MDGTMWSPPMWTSPICGSTVTPALHAEKEAADWVNDRQLVALGLSEFELQAREFRQKLGLLRSPTKRQHPTYEGVQTTLVQIALAWAASAQGGWAACLGRGYDGGLERGIRAVQLMQTFIELFLDKQPFELAQNMGEVHAYAVQLQEWLNGAAMDHNELYVDVSALMGQADEARGILAKDAQAQKQLIKDNEQAVQQYKHKRQQAQQQMYIGAGTAIGLGAVSAAVGVIVPPIGIALAVGFAVAALYAVVQKAKEVRQTRKAAKAQMEAESAQAAHISALNAIEALRDNLCPCIAAFHSAISSTAAAFNTIVSDIQRFAHISNIKQLDEKARFEFEFKMTQLEDILRGMSKDCQQLSQTLPCLQQACLELQDLLPPFHQASTTPPTPPSHPPAPTWGVPYMGPHPHLNPHPSQ